MRMLRLRLSHDGQCVICVSYICLFSLDSAYNWGNQSWISHKIPFSKISSQIFILKKSHYIKQVWIWAFSSSFLNIQNKQGVFRAISVTMDKKWSFLLSISLINVNKFVVFWGFAHIHYIFLNGKLHLLCSV